MRSDLTTLSWGIDEVPDLSGKTILITGANTGIGRATATVLARRGASVVLACRDQAKAEAAAAAIDATAPAGSVSVLTVDLASLASVSSAADALLRRHDRLDVLINNAGVMTLVGPPRQTADDFEQHIGINHLGHFALTGRLLPLLLAAPAARVVWVSSLSQRKGAIDFDDLHWRARRYRAFQAYSDSKLANMLTMYQMQHQLDAANASVMSVAAHPGGARTDITRDGPLWMRLLARPETQWCTNWLTHDIASAALPTVRAAVDPDVRGGDVYGPAGWQGLTGPPIRVDLGSRARDETLQRTLWNRSQELTDVTYRLVRT
ncbi:oxidoreductase [Micromonospora endolithica]|uniref:SDR family NAD(P)-dependent oxidoreductase n=1 Tax=Micromonospora endolithica TaxID=230091 RepID=A0A3A9ZT23_9ACTN|nr:oxidoreductase [Micromonospora endolithica]RKN50627.1 SDR family NAD(P)-dependent oxidoreductase [Micromonospora endolithica]TWJ20647.1 NAD(P)-dependent dehydrogenase (short-subunit alcohol dehydrogenase family) [Micromonospora endolithica]